MNQSFQTHVNQLGFFRDTGQAAGLRQNAIFDDQCCSHVHIYAYEYDQINAFLGFLYPFVTTSSRFITKFAAIVHAASSAGLSFSSGFDSP